MAHSETIMWQAYYEGNRARLALETITLLRRHYGLPAHDAVQIADKLAEAAIAFSQTRTDYDQLVLPALIEAYVLIQTATSEDFDPQAAARADLDWWVARRTPGQQSSREVGRRITALYEILYGYPHPAFTDAGLYRARAAQIRDRGGQNADWAEVERLLLEGYRHLLQGVQAGGEPNTTADLRR